MRVFHNYVSLPIETQEQDLQDFQDFQDYTRVGLRRAGTVSAGHGRFPDIAIPNIVKIVKIV